MRVIVKNSCEEFYDAAAEIVKEVITEKPDCVLGMATGSTQLGLYRQLIRMHREEGLDFSNVTSFSLDEYVGLPPAHEQSYHHFMRVHLFDHINMKPDNIYIPDGMTEDVDGFCEWYESEITRRGGVDLQILGIGSNGHIAFNEPGSSLGSRTRIKTLTESTIKDNSKFFSSIEEVPKYTITVGIGTIMDARAILLLADGKAKAGAIAKTIEGPVTAMVPATIVQMHRRATIIVDREAGAKITIMTE
ncbi:glucosamine-6-phosphate deaminase [candidate division KSB1 bacterium]